MEDVDWDDVENVPWDPEPNMGVPFSSYGYPDNCVVPLCGPGSGQGGQHGWLSPASTWAQARPR